MVEGSGFENRRTARYQGFESLLLRRSFAPALQSFITTPPDGGADVNCKYEVTASPAAE